MVTTDKPTVKSYPSFNIQVLCLNNFFILLVYQWKRFFILRNSMEDRDSTDAHQAPMSAPPPCHFNGTAQRDEYWGVKETSTHLVASPPRTN